MNKQKFQDLEEERLDFTKSSLWAFANIASTVCVSDDASCEKIRLSLENCEVEKDIVGFIKMRGTGQEIPDPPRYINFCRGDVDSASEVSDDDNYSVAQFHRTTKPEFRTASPSHSASGSQYNPQSELAQRINEGTGIIPAAVSVADEEDVAPSRTNSGRPAPLNYRQPEPNVPPNYSPSQHGEINQVPHNQFPTDGMTMYCRTGPPSVTGSGLSSNTRPSSRDDQSEYSNPTSYTSADPMSGKNSPTKGYPPAGGVAMPGMVPSSPDKALQKKRSGFFSNSPFRRKSKREAEREAQPPRSTWQPPASASATTSRVNLTPSHTGSQSANSSPTRPNMVRQPASFGLRNRDPTPDDGEDRPDPRASFQLNVGDNLFDVASPDSQSHQSTPKASMANRLRGFPGTAPASVIGDDDPVAQALAELKLSTGSALGMSKQASMRVQADRLYGVQTPAPDSAAAARPAPISAASADRLAAQRGTPPPAYDRVSAGTPSGRGSALGVPEPAFTSRDMRARTENWGTGSNASTSRPTGNDRSRSPGPARTRFNPSPQHQHQAPAMRARSPGPSAMARARSPGPGRQQPPSPNSDSPYPQIQTGRPKTSGQRPGSGMEIQLSSSDVQRYDQGSGRSRSGMTNNGSQRPSSAFGGDSYQQHHSPQGRGGMMDPQLRRERSKSMAAIAGPKVAAGGGGVLYYGSSHP